MMELFIFVILGFFLGLFVGYFNGRIDRKGDDR